MTDTRAARANRRASGRAETEPAVNTSRPRGRPRSNRASGRNTAEPRVEHPEDDDGHHDDRHDEDVDPEHSEDAESSHPSRRQSASTLGRPAPSPNTALLMAVELFRYHPTTEAHDN